MHIEIAHGTMTVSGLIKTYDDSKLFDQEMHLALRGVHNRFLTIRIPDSFIVTSAIIGYMLKAIKEDNAKLSLQVKDDDLYGLFNHLELIQALNVKKY